MMFLLVFVAMTALDFVYAEYTKAAADRRIWSASIYAAVLIALTSFVTSSYVNDAWLVAPAVLGAFFGTWLSIRFGK